MKNLIDIYGYCIIPNDTLLFRGHKDNSFDDCMFFATKHWVAGAFDYESIQVWKTTTDIRVLFLVEYLNDDSWTISAIPRLYNSIFPLESDQNLNDLDIKHWDVNKRNKLVRQLFDNHKISGWLTSLEDKVELEVCLFDKHANSKQLILLDAIDHKNRSYIKDSLERIDVFPAEKFYIRTAEQLNQRAPVYADGDNHYDRYNDLINAWIDDEMSRGMSREEAEHYHMNLRTKLKV